MQVPKLSGSAQQQHTRPIQAPCALTKEPGPPRTQQLHRRSLLLGVLVGSQLVGLPNLQQAYAEGVPEITTVGFTELCLLHLMLTAAAGAMEVS